jgi:hypothetical protein
MSEKSRKSSVYGTAYASSSGKGDRSTRSSGSSKRPWRSGNVQLDYVRSEIERMRIQVARQRREILQLQRAGISTGSAEALLQRMLDKIDSLCVERQQLKAEQRHPRKDEVLGGR